MPTEFDQIQRDKRLQEHWVRRLVAFIIDAIIIWIIISVILLFFILHPFLWFFTWSFLTGIIVLLYTGILEGTRGATFGKQLLKLRVVSFRSPMDLNKGFVRNVSKIFWLLLILDLVAGFFTDGEPKQRYLDRIAGTTVEDLPIPKYP